MADEQLATTGEHEMEMDAKSGNSELNVARKNDY
jgi:hypothetical protein